MTPRDLGSARYDAPPTAPPPSVPAAQRVGAALLAALTLGGCDTPSTQAVLDNRYPAGALPAQVVYRGYWQSVPFPAPVPPGASSDPQAALPASDNLAYALLAPGWDPASADPPAALVLLVSRAGFALHLNDTVHIPVDDTAFAGNCAAGSHLEPDQAELAARLFPDELAGLTYQPATCTTGPVVDGGGP